MVEAHLARGGIMMLKQRPGVVEQHLGCNPAKAQKRALTQGEPRVSAGVHGIFSCVGCMIMSGLKICTGDLLAASEGKV